MVNVNANSQLKNLWVVGALLAYEPKANNFYEARVPGRVFKGWSDWFIDLWAQSNRAKKYYIYTEAFYVARSFFKSKRYLFDFKQNFRFSPKFSIGQETNLQPQTDNVGFATLDGNDIIFGRRDVSTVENTFNVKYSFNDRMVFTAIGRHYWSEVNYKEYFTLQQDGSLGKNNTFTRNANQNYNIITVDAVYTWQFAPGSFINLVWKKNATTFDDITTSGYLKKFDQTISDPQNNKFSVKVIYFLDYLKIKDWNKKKG